MRPQCNGSEIVARSDAMRRVLDLAQRAAQSDVTVLITGDGGVGKEVVARWIHDRGARAQGPFIRLDCAAISRETGEASLFGGLRGTYTDERTDSCGVFERASDGTLLLDEVGELPRELQPKLLHALEDLRLRSSGGDRGRAAPARLIAVTNARLERSVESRSFRADLFHRLNVVRIDVPPLRSRIEDLRPLVDQILPRVAARLGRRIRGVSASALHWMESYDWPGNVRELVNTLERAVALADHDVLLAADVRPAEPVFVDNDHLAALARSGASLAHVEQRYMEIVLAECDHNKARAARLLGVDRRTLYRKLCEFEGATSTGRRQE